MHSDKERVHEVDWGGTSLAQCGVIKKFSPCLYFLVNTWLWLLRCSIFTVESEKRRAVSRNKRQTYPFHISTYFPTNFVLKNLKTNKRSSTLKFSRLYIEIIILIGKVDGLTYDLNSSASITYYIKQRVANSQLKFFTWSSCHSFRLPNTIMHAVN